MTGRKATVVGLAVSMPLIAITAVGFRIQARRVKRNSLSWDDYLSICSLICCIGCAIVTLIAVHPGGLGNHLVYNSQNVPVNMKNYIVFSKCGWSLQFLSVSAAGLTKLSVLFFYKRIFTGNVFKATTSVMIGLIAAWDVALSLVVVFNCIPPRLNWEPQTSGTGHCNSFTALGYGIFVSDIVTDAIILTFPWPQIRKLQMSPTRKILIGAIFALGWFVVGAGIARTVAGIRAFATVTTDFDYTYSRVSVFYWTVIEVCVGVISSCLPTMRPLLFHYLGDHPVSSIRSALGMRSRNSDDTLVSTGPQAAAKDSFELSLVPERPQRLNSSIVEKTSTNSLPRPAEAIAVQRDFDFISNRV